MTTHWNPTKYRPLSPGQYRFWNDLLSFEEHWWLSEKGYWTRNEHGDFGGTDDEPWDDPNLTHWERVERPEQCRKDARE